MNNHQRMKCYQIPYFSSSRMEVFNNAYNFCLSIWEYNDHLRANNMSFRTLRQYQTFGLCRWGERAWSAFFTSCKTQWEISLALAEEGLHTFPWSNLRSARQGYLRDTILEMVKYSDSWDSFLYYRFNFIDFIMIWYDMIWYDMITDFNFARPFFLTSTKRYTNSLYETYFGVRRTPQTSIWRGCEMPNH